MPFSVEPSNSFLNFMFSKVNTLTAPSAVYMALSSNDPEADGGTFTEFSGNNYARVLVGLKGETYPDFISSAANRTIKNTKQIVFNKATGDWVTAKGFGLFSAPTGGTPFYYAKLDAEVTVPIGAVALFDPNTLIIGFANTDD